MMLKDPKHLMIPGTSQKMCPEASADKLVQLFQDNRCKHAQLLDFNSLYHVTEGLRISQIKTLLLIQYV